MSVASIFIISELVNVYIFIYFYRQTLKVKFHGRHFEMSWKEKVLHLCFFNTVCQNVVSKKSYFSHWIIEAVSG